MNKKFLILSGACVFAITAALTPSLAEDIQVINKIKEELTITITPESNSLEPFSTIAKTITTQEESRLMVNYDDLKGHKYYNIKKANGDFAGLSRCDHLSVEKQYTIEFKKEPLGLICTAKELD